MQPYSMEQSILDCDNEVKELFQHLQKNSERLDAYEMGKDIFVLAMKIGRIAMQGYFAKKGPGDVGEILELKDGTKMQRQSKLRSRKYFSIFGKFDVFRTYYYTKGEEGAFPLDAAANLPKRSYSYLLQKWMDLCSVRDSFDESNITLSSLLGIDISQSNFEIINRESAINYDEFYKNKKLPDSDDEGEIQVIQFDGKGVPMIKSEAAKIKSRLGKGEKRQKKKEAMVGIDYTVDRDVRTPEQVAKNLIYPEEAKKTKKESEDNSPCVRAKNIRRMASLERPKAEVMNEIVNEATRRNSDKKRPMVVVMDGALCLWNAISLILAGIGIKWVGILDIIHVVEYLWSVGNALNGEKTLESEKWVYSHLLSILQGRVGRVIGGLKQILTKRGDKLTKTQKKAIEDVITYFKNHRQWMKYDDYLKEGYPIGSGVVESTCGHTVKNRMEGTGRRWSIKGAEPMLLLRSVYTSNDWDEYLCAHRHIEGQKLYGKFYNAVEYADDYYVQKAA